MLFAATIVVLAGCGGNGRTVVNAHTAVLRAGDLPRGYREGDDTVCGTASATEGDWVQLESLFLSALPSACIIELNRVWATPGPYPPGITSAAYVFHDTTAAERAFRDRNELLSYTASLDTKESEDAKLGDEARLVRGRGLNDPAAAVVWRSGDIVAVLAVEPADESAAVALAKKQQRRIEGTAPPPRRVDEVELELDDPSLDLPVYWLGRSFHPAGGLPELTLEEATVLGTGPGDTVKLDYGGAAEGRAVHLTLDLWEPERWKRFRRTVLGRLVWDSPCARITTVQLPDGHAEIFEGYGTPRPLTSPCPTRPPDRVLAHVYLAGVVVAVNMPYCYACAAPFATENPFETVAGMTAVARGLERRTS